MPNFDFKGERKKSPTLSSITRCDDRDQKIGSFDRVCPRNALDSTSTDQGLGTGPLVGRVGLATDKSRCCYGAGSGSCASPV
ncbi:hypothetical protein VDGL01_01020 [Verticillium dahliae]